MIDDAKIISRGDRLNRMSLKVVRWPAQEQKENFHPRGRLCGAGYWASDGKVKWL